jgi:hypothetical protein
MDNKNLYNIKIRRRPWWMWLLAALWLVVEVFFLQCALASPAEHEPRATLIFWVLFAVIAVAGALIWILRGRSKA